MITSVELKGALEVWAAGLRVAAAELNALDGRLGDGDLGTTLEKCAANVSEAIPIVPETISGIFQTCASACAKASGSSFGTLLAVAFITAAKATVTRNDLSKADIVMLLDSTTEALASRGGAALGDKTMLDSINAIARALEEAASDDDLKQVAVDGCHTVLNAYRDKPNKIGRARMFADKSIGMDDPGMVAVLRMVQSL